MNNDPEVLKAIEFLDSIRDPTLENVYTILQKLATYAYKMDKTSGDYSDMFVLIGLAYYKCGVLLGKE